MSQRKEKFRIDLYGDDVHYYKTIKSANHFRKNIDVFRHALRTTYELEQDLNTPYSVIPSAMKEHILQLLRRDDINHKFQVYSIEDVIRKGVELIIKEMETHRKGISIFNWDVRSSMSGDQKDVAMAIYEVQNASPTHDVTSQEIAEELEWKNIKKIQDIMDEFVSRKMLDMEITAGIRRYHAE